MAHLLASVRLENLVQRMDGLLVERNRDQRLARLARSFPSTPDVMDVQANALVARARNAEIQRQLPGPTVRLGDRLRRIVDSVDSVEKALVEARRG